MLASAQEEMALASSIGRWRCFCRSPATSREGGDAAEVAMLFNSHFDNHESYPPEIQFTDALAKESNGQYTAEDIRAQMQLMGNEAYHELPDTTRYLTGVDAVRANIVQDLRCRKAPAARPCMNSGQSQRGY